ncbi:hypothetical protein QQ020_07550 [Fulvivirgaceae bacterium BMA12]|uniref:Nucleotide modification associated domain-containing protein n=1 Tax=Agaribacillus aureus TaxID=3051825 RepID=A0ABT8L2C0_9BACT|nr:hypothetical protein [Fulvivirgaceae bacterium BMA12]
MPKIILSRKGFDSSAGGKPSFLWNDKLYSIPVPQAYSEVAYKKLQIDENISYWKIMEDVGITQYSDAHLDPDLRKEVLQRENDPWLPIFGQADSALTHLLNEGVGEGDLFLFFGWFKEIEQLENGNFSHIKGKPDLHVIYGFLEVGEYFDVYEGKEHDNPAVQQHIHHQRKDRYTVPGKNGLFIGSGEPTFFKRKAGLFKFDKKLILTESGESRSNWLLPRCFFKDDGRCKLSHHKEKVGELANDDSYRIKSVARGQEFVAEMDDDIREWVETLKDLVI